MTRATTSRIAGAAFLLYIAIGLTQLSGLAGTTAGERSMAVLAAQATNARVNEALGFFTCILALTLGVTLWSLTRDEDDDVAMFGLACRVAEGIIGAAPIPMSLALVSLASSDASAAAALAPLVQSAQRWNPLVAATFFAAGSTAFTWLFLRGRLIPQPLAWLGVVASVLLVVLLPLQMSGLLGSPVLELMWLPMLAFEVPLGVWLIVRGAGDSWPRVSARVVIPWL